MSYLASAASEGFPLPSLGLCLLLLALLLLLATFLLHTALCLFSGLLLLRLRPLSQSLVACVGRVQKYGSVRFAALPFRTPLELESGNVFVIGGSPYAKSKTEQTSNPTSQASHQVLTRCQRSNQRKAGVGCTSRIGTYSS